MLNTIKEKLNDKWILTNILVDAKWLHKLGEIELSHEFHDEPVCSKGKS